MCHFDRLECNCRDVDCSFRVPDGDFDRSDCCWRDTGDSFDAPGGSLRHKRRQLSQAGRQLPRTGCVTAIVRSAGCAIGAVTFVVGVEASTETRFEARRVFQVEEVRGRGLSLLHGTARWPRRDAGDRLIADRERGAIVGGLY